MVGSMGEIIPIPLRVRKKILMIAAVLITNHDRRGVHNTLTCQVSAGKLRGIANAKLVPKNLPVRQVSDASPQSEGWNLFTSGPGRDAFLSLLNPEGAAAAHGVQKGDRSLKEAKMSQRICYKFLDNAPALYFQRVGDTATEQEAAFRFLSETVMRVLVGFPNGIDQEFEKRLQIRKAFHAEMTGDDSAQAEADVLRRGQGSGVVGQELGAGDATGGFFRRRSQEQILDWARAKGKGVELELAGREAPHLHRTIAEEHDDVGVHCKRVRTQFLVPASQAEREFYLKALFSGACLSDSRADCVSIPEKKASGFLPPHLWVESPKFFAELLQRARWELAAVEAARKSISSRAKYGSSQQFKATLLLQERRARMGLQAALGLLARRSELLWEMNRQRASEQGQAGAAPATKKVEVVRNTITPPPRDLGLIALYFLEGEPQSPLGGEGLPARALRGKRRALQYLYGVRAPAPAAGVGQIRSLLRRAQETVDTSPPEADAPGHHLRDDLLYESRFYDGELASSLERVTFPLLSWLGTLPVESPAGAAVVDKQHPLGLPLDEEAQRRKEEQEMREESPGARSRDRGRRQRYRLETAVRYWAKHRSEKVFTFGVRPKASGAVGDADAQPPAGRAPAAENEGPADEEYMPDGLPAYSIQFSASSRPVSSGQELDGTPTIAYVRISCADVERVPTKEEDGHRVEGQDVGMSFFGRIQYDVEKVAKPGPSRITFPFVDDGSRASGTSGQGKEQDLSTRTPWKPPAQMLFGTAEVVGTRGPSRKDPRRAAASASAPEKVGVVFSLREALEYFPHTRAATGPMRPPGEEEEEDAPRDDWGEVVLVDDPEEDVERRDVREQLKRHYLSVLMGDGFDGQEPDWEQMYLPPILFRGALVARGGTLFHDPAAKRSSSTREDEVEEEEDRHRSLKLFPVYTPAGFALNGQGIVEPPVIDVLDHKSRDPRTRLRLVREMSAPGGTGREVLRHYVDGEVEASFGTRADFEDWESESEHSENLAPEAGHDEITRRSQTPSDDPMDVDYEGRVGGRQAFFSGSPRPLEAGDSRGLLYEPALNETTTTFLDAEPVLEEPNPKHPWISETPSTRTPSSRRLSEVSQASTPSPTASSSGAHFLQFFPTTMAPPAASYFPQVGQGASPTAPEHQGAILYQQQPAIDVAFASEMQLHPNNYAQQITQAAQQQAYHTPGAAAATFLAPYYPAVEEVHANFLQQQTGLMNQVPADVQQTPFALFPETQQLLFLPSGLGFVFARQADPALHAGFTSEPQSSQQRQSPEPESPQPESPQSSESPQSEPQEPHDSPSDPDADADGQSSVGQETDGAPALGDEYNFVGNVFPGFSALGGPVREVDEETGADQSQFRGEVRLQAQDWNAFAYCQDYVTKWQRIDETLTGEVEEEDGESDAEGDVDVVEGGAGQGTTPAVGVDADRREQEDPDAHIQRLMQDLSEGPDADLWFAQSGNYSSHPLKTLYAKGIGLAWFEQTRDICFGLLFDLLDEESGSRGDLLRPGWLAEQVQSVLDLCLDMNPALVIEEEKLEVLLENFHLPKDFVAWKLEGWDLPSAWSGVVRRG